MDLFKSLEATLVELYHKSPTGVDLFKSLEATLVELYHKSPTGVDLFKSLEATLVELYHKSPFCWSGLRQVGEILQAKVFKPVKLVGIR